MPESDAEDTALLARLRTGNEAAFALILDTWSAGMIRLAKDYAAARRGDRPDRRPRAVPSGE
ncbi:hypothetical protein [Nocardia sp. NPDC005366]|uniref:hypothetical protein n=1 Tax=Nocardia sp. NPDC005366 TaxID=3156878 RepID=UPI00339F767E